MLRSLLPMSEHLGIMGASGKDVPTKERAKPRSALERILEHGYEFISTSARSLLIRDDDEDDIPQINMSGGNAAAGFVDTTTSDSCLPQRNDNMMNGNGNSSAAAAAALAPVDGGDEVLPPEFYSLFGGCAMGK